MSQGYIFYHLRAQVFNERQVQVQKTQLNSEDFKYTLQVMSHNNKAQDVMTKPHTRRWGDDDLSVRPGPLSS